MVEAWHLLHSYQEPKRFLRLCHLDARQSWPAQFERIAATPQPTARAQNSTVAQSVWMIRRSEPGSEQNTSSVPTPTSSVRSGDGGGGGVGEGAGLRRSREVSTAGNGIAAALQSRARPKHARDA